MADLELNSTDDIVPTFAESQAKMMFDRVLVCWASDLLELRRQGLVTPGWREMIEGGEGPEWRRAA
jgi:hypothetical protein